MDEEISIIDAKTRNEKIKDFFINNKKRIPKTPLKKEIKDKRKMGHLTTLV